MALFFRFGFRRFRSKKKKKIRKTNNVFLRGWNEIPTRIFLFLQVLVKVITTHTYREKHAETAKLVWSQEEEKEMKIVESAGKK